MYWKHFSLNRRPFAIAPDPDLMIWTRRHKEAFDALHGETMAQAPLTLLTGEVGCGKSTLLQALLRSDDVREKCQPVLISVRVGTAHEFVQHVCRALQGSLPSCSFEENLRQMGNVLDMTRASGLLPLIILDEAQTLATDAALLIARLARGELTVMRAPSILLSGQPEFLALIGQAGLEPLSHAIGKRLKLGPLSREEVATFIQGRLEAVGSEGGVLFENSAVEVINTYSGGVPRLINKFCELCLFSAARQKRETIDAEFARSVLEQFSPPGGTIPVQDPLRAPLEDLTDTFVFSKPPELRREKAPEGQAARLRPDPVTPIASPSPPAPVIREVTTGVPAGPQPGMSIDPGQTAAPPVRPVTRPRHALRGYLRGALVAAACATPFLLVLPEPLGLDAESPRASEDGSEVSGASVARETPPVQPQVASVAGDDPTSDTSAADPLVAQEAAVELDALTRAIETARNERAAVIAELQRNRVDAARTASQLTAARDELKDLRAQLLKELGTLEDVQARIEAKERRLVAVTQETARAGEELARLKDDLSASGPGAAETALVSRSAFQPTGMDVLVPTLRQDTALLTPAVLLESLAPSADQTVSTYFERALDSTNATEIALNYARAAVRGHARAATYLGQLFETGDGVALNAEMARRWYRVAEDADLLHSADLVSADAMAATERVSAIAAFTDGDSADIVWDGAADRFTLELADADVRPIAYFETPLTAARVRLPEGARFWRVSAGLSASSDWQPLDAPTRD